MNTKKEKLDTRTKTVKAISPKTLKSISGGATIAHGMVIGNSFESTTQIKTKTGNKQIIDLNVITRLVTL